MIIKYKDRIKTRKITTGMLVGILILSNLTPLMAITIKTTEPSPDIPSTPLTTTEDSWDSGRDPVYREEIRIEVPPTPHRTVSVLDVAKVVYTHNTLFMDYKPTELANKVTDLIPEIELADVIEYEGEKDKGRESLRLNGKSSPIYSGQLQYLIENNMINRNTYFMYDSEGVYTSQRRLPNPLEKAVTPSSENKNNMHAYYNQDDPVSKTDLLMGLMKTGEVIMSKPIITRKPYTRMGGSLTLEEILYEPLETSVYSRYMGELGIDPNAHDVVMSHAAFGSSEVLVTSDVVEQYLEKALSLNIVNKDDIGGVEGSNFLTQYSNSRLKDGWKFPSTPIRQFYKEIVPTDKLFGEGIIYQLDQYNAYINGVNKRLLDVNCVESGILDAWGQTYSTNVSRCAMADPYSTNSTEIVKRPSSVQVKNGFKSFNKDKGYQFFKEEELSVSDAYRMAYDYLMSAGYEPTILKPEYITSKFSLDLSKYTAEERTATEYLISMGIVNGDDSNLSRATSLPLTNLEMVDLMYRISNKSARYELSGELTDTDIDMAKRGFSQAKINISTEPSQDLGTHMMVSDKRTESYSKIQIDDRIKNPYQYDMVYIRIPKVITDKVYPGGFQDGDDTSAVDGYFRLVTDDKNRITIDPINDRALNGGVSGLEHDTSQMWETEKMYDGSGRYVYQDKDGYMWYRYFIHKDLSYKTMITSFSSTGSATFKGIKGEGIYFIEEGVTTGNFMKVDMKDAESHPTVGRIYKLLVDFDLSTRVKLQTIAVQDNKKEDAFPGRKMLWQQTMFAEPKTQQVSMARGLISEESMPVVTYKGQPMFVQTYNADQGVNGWQINPSAPMDPEIRDGYDLHYEENKGYTISYTSVTQEESMAQAELMWIEVGQEPESSSKPVMGYAKMTVNGEEVVLISEREIEALGIERAERKDGDVSDKGLFNPKTGQRGFLDTDLDVTIIGNNITKYPENHLIVTSIGGEVYYNLNVMLEMINDSAVVYKRAGSSIFLNTNSTIDPSEYFHRADIKDILHGGAGNPNTIDTTYMLYSTNDASDRYMNLSALTNAASNFLFYKNRDGENDFQALITYEPDVGDHTLTSTTLTQLSRNPSYTDNGIISNYSQGKEGINSQAVDTVDVGYAKKKILDKLFGMGDRMGSQVLKGAYKLDIKVLNTSPSAGSHTEALNRFINFVSDGDRTVQTRILKDMEYNHSELGLPAIDDSDTYNLSKSTKLGFMQAATSRAQPDNFLIHEATGNLYYKITANKLPNHMVLQDIIKQRFFYDTSNNKIYLRKKEYYENTPNGYIPLELYGKAGYRDFNILDDDRTTDGVGLSYNFGEGRDPSPKYKLTMAPGDNNLGNATVRIPMMIGDSAYEYGLATNIEVPYVAMGTTSLKNYLAMDPSTFAKKMFELHVAEVGKQIGDDYPLRLAMGNIENNATVSVGYMNNYPGRSKMSFITGNWAGKDDISYPAFYVPEPCDNSTCIHEKHYTITMGPDVIGRTPTDGYNTDVRFYLHEIGEIYKTKGWYKTLNTTKIWTYDDLPDDIKELIEDSPSGLDIDLPIYFKPTVAIPAGTTLVSKEDELVYKPNHSIRTKLNRSTDIINNMLARMQEIDNFEGVNMLGEADKYSIVNIGDRKLIVLSEPQEVKQLGDGRLQWVSAFLIPQSTSSGYAKLGQGYFKEITLMDETLEELESIRLPTQNGIAEVSLLEILGPGQYRIPTIDEFINVKERHDSKITGASEGLMDKLGAIYVIDPDSIYSREEGPIKRYETKIVQHNRKKGTKPEDLIGTGGAATVAKVLLLPPTIQIEEINSITPDYRTYNATKYWDIDAFNMDPNGDIIGLLMEHDTDAKPFEIKFESSKKNNLDGSYFKRYSFSQFIKFIYDLGVEILLRAIPLALALVWLMISVLTVVFWFPKTKEWGRSINNKYGKDLISNLTLGVVDVHSENPDFIQFLLASMFLWALVVLMWDGYLIRYIIVLIIGDGEFITNLTRNLKSVFGG